MIPKFYVTGSSEPRPDVDRVLFADGSADDTFQGRLDLELSHWVPNETLPRWKADTSTEICLNFVADPPDEDFPLCVNNHVDTDGLLSLFALVHSELALEHRDTLVGAAEVGDFQACAPRRALRLYQGLAVLAEVARAESWDPMKTYRAAFERIPELLAGATPDDLRVTAGLDAFERSIERIEVSEVMVAEAAPRLTLFQYPMLEDEELELALRVPAFNSPLDTPVWLLPQARNRFDGEAVQLVTIPSGEGQYHDLWYPGYMWAETPGRWRAPGFEFAGSTNGYRYAYPPLERAVERLAQLEDAPGTWTLASELTPFSAVRGRGFPVVLSFLDAEGRPAPSRLSSSEVADQLVDAFPDSPPGQGA